jgi:hypothetical protein
MAELHIIGQLVGATGFDGHSVFCKVRGARPVRTRGAMRRARHDPGASPPADTAFCAAYPPTNPRTQWGVHAGRSWELVEGLDGGQTQADCPSGGGGGGGGCCGGGAAVWGHPLDVHFVCRALSGWPKLHLQIWAQDVHGRNELSELMGKACGAGGQLARWQGGGGGRRASRRISGCADLPPLTPLPTQPRQKATASATSPQRPACLSWTARPGCQRRAPGRARAGVADTSQQLLLPAA